MEGLTKPINQRCCATFLYRGALHPFRLKKAWLGDFVSRPAVNEANSCVTLILQDQITGEKAEMQAEWELLNPQSKIQNQELA
jgi:hypothetical protein